MNSVVFEKNVLFKIFLIFGPPVQKIRKKFFVVGDIQGNVF